MGGITITTRVKDDRSAPYLCIRKLTTSGPTCRLEAWVLRYGSQSLQKKQDRLVMVESARKLSCVYDAVLVIVEGFEHLSPLLQPRVERDGKLLHE